VSVTSSAVDGVGNIYLDRPGRMNAINVELAVELGHAITELGRDADVQVIVIQGAGATFCAGGDFDEVLRLRADGATALRSLFTAFRAACDAIATVDVPVITAVRGVAAAGGFELMQAADIVLISEDARIADSHIKFGMIPGGGSTARLPRLVGRQQAMGLLLSGDEISGVEAVDLGLAYHAYPPDDFDQAVARFAAKLAARRRESVVAIKRLVRSALSASLDEALDAEVAAVVEHILATPADNTSEQFLTRRNGGTRK
jgi:enoyl-CoA hydratase/carnithine racemase